MSKYLPSQHNASFPPPRIVISAKSSPSVLLQQLKLPAATKPLVIPSAADLNFRRSISDSSVAKWTSSTCTYDSKNTAYMMMNRSGGSTVKKIIKVIIEKCEQAERESFEDEQQQEQKTMPIQPPEGEVFILAQWAVDSYYKVVIRTNHGIAAIVRAMKAFDTSRSMQESCCLALGNLCYNGVSNGFPTRSPHSRSSNIANATAAMSAIPLSDTINSRTTCPATLKAIQEVDGVYHIITAMKNFQQSVAVQSAACDALRNMSDIILLPTSSSNFINTSYSESVYESVRIDMEMTPTEPTLKISYRDELIRVLSCANEMFLHPMHRHTVQTLLEAILNLE